MNCLWQTLKSALKMKLKRPPNDRDVFIDNNDNIYQVFTYVHEPDAIYAFKKYQLVTKPMPEHFLWERDGKKYQRVLRSYALDDIVDNIEENEYMRESSIFGPPMTCVPLNSIKEYLYPEDFTANIVESFSNNGIKYLKEFFDLILSFRYLMNILLPFLTLTSRVSYCHSYNDYIFYTCHFHKIPVHSG